MNVHVPVTCAHEYSCYPWRVLIKIHVPRDVCSWIFMLLGTCAHEYLCHPWRVSWILMLHLTCGHEYSWPVTCNHKYSCYPWRVLMNIHVTRNVCSWIFMLSVTFLVNIHVYRDLYVNIHTTRDVSHEYPCQPWRMLMNIQISRDVCSWLFMLPVTCSYEYSRYPLRVLMIIHVSHDVSHEYSYPWRVYLNYTWLSHNIVNFHLTCFFFKYSCYPSRLYWVTECKIFSSKNSPSF